MKLVNGVWMDSVRVHGTEMIRYFCVEVKTSGEGDISISEIYSEAVLKNRNFVWGFYEYFSDYETARRRAQCIREELRIKAVI
jgi:hypothetical protein